MLKGGETIVKVCYLITFIPKGEDHEPRRVIEVSDFHVAIEALWIIGRGGALDVHLYKGLPVN